MFKTILFRLSFAFACSSLFFSQSILTQDSQQRKDSSKEAQSNVPIFLDAFDKNPLAETTTETLGENSEAQLGKKYQINSSGIFLNDLNSLLQKHQKLVLVFQGKNSVSLSIMDKEKKYSFMQSQVTLEEKLITVVPIDRSNLISQQKVCLKVATFFQQETFVEFLVADDFDISFNKSYKILANLSMNLNFRFKNFYKHLSENPENRVQFIARTSLKRQLLHGQEYISMKINNKRTSFPEEGEADLVASGNMGFGLIKTINNKNEFYCREEACEYRVTIKTLNIEYLYFFPTIVANGAEFTFNRNINVLEELEPDEVIYYILKVPQNQLDWVFRTIPSSFAPHYYVNPDEKAKDFTKSFYKVENQLQTEILISNEEKGKFGFKDETFYLTFKNPSSTDPCTFQFHMEIQDPTKIMRHIRHNYVHQGNMYHGEFLTFGLNLFQDEPHVNSILLELSSLHGEVNLYLKECLDKVKCEFDLNEIGNVSDQQLPSNIMKATNIQNQVNNEIVTTSRLLLNVNCLGSGFVTKKEIEVSNTFKKSRFCSFIIGLQEVVTEKKNVVYKLLTKGEEISHPLTLRQSHNLTVQQHEKEYYYIKLEENRTGKPKTLRINVVSLVGNVRLFFSNSQTKPSEEDNDLEIKTVNSKKNFLQSSSYQAQLQIPLSNSQNVVYIGVEGKKYSVLDLYVIPAEEIHNDEEISVENEIKRTITAADSYFASNMITYFKTFHFKPKEEYVNSEKFVIHNNSNILGLEICVQLKNDNFDIAKNCDLKTSSDNLTVPKGDWEDLVFMVRKSVKENEMFQNFPIEINVLITSDSKLQWVTLHQEGKYHASKVQAEQIIIYQVNFSLMKRKFLLLFQTESSSVHAEIFGTREEDSKIGDLDRISFGYEELRGDQFKEKYCNSKSCFIYVHVINRGSSPVDYSFLYTVDDSPIHLPIGKEVYIPASIQTNYFTKVDKNSDVSFHFFSEKVYFEAFGNVIEEKGLTQSKLEGQISEYRYEYKTNLDRQDEIVMSPHFLSTFQSPVALFTLIPKDGFEVNNHQMAQGLQIYDRENMVRVTFHQGEEKLEPFKEKEESLEKGEFNVYNLSLETPQNFTLFLSVHTGKVLMVMNKGYGNQPTQKNHWKKLGSLLGGEIIVSKKDLEEGEKEFTVAVYAEDDTKFSLVYMPEFHNIFPLKYQHLTEKKLKKGQTYYFDFYNELNKFHSIFYAQYSDIEVSVMEYSKLMNQDFLTVIKDEQNYLQKFTFKQGDIPRKKMSEVPLDLRYHYVFRMKPLTNDAEVFFLLYDKAKPILVPSKKQFSFTLDQDDSQMFEFDFPSSFEEVTIDCKMIHGKITVKISNTMDFQHQMELSGAEHKHLKYDVEHKDKDIVIFDKINVFVLASELSSFKCRVIPKGQFKEIHPYEVELIQISPTEDIYVYFNLEESDAQRQISIDIYLENSYEKPDFLYSGEQSVQIEDSQGFLPMPVEDFNEKLESKVRHLQVTPSPVKGSFIVKFKPSKEHVHAKISLTFNGFHIIDPNGIQRKFLNSKSNEDNYSIYLPSAGEFRIIPDTCAGMSIQDPSFVSDQEINAITFEDNYAQAYPFLFYSESEKGKSFKEYKKLVMGIKRGLINNPGVLKFNASHQKTENKSQYSYFLTEFRPQNKELVLKDYIDLWGDNEELNKLQSSVSIDKEKNSLKVDFLSPRFKKQLLEDYPELKSVILTYKFYLVKDSAFFEKFITCGFRAIEEYEHVQKQMQIHLAREKIEDHRENYWLHFEKENLGHYFNEKFLNLYGEIEFIIVEKDDDRNNISLNQKFTVVPFFYMVIDNKFLTSHTWMFFLGLALGLAFLYCLLKRRKQNSDMVTIDDVQKYKKSRKDYQQVQKANFEDIEMN